MKQTNRCDPLQTKRMVIIWEQTQKKGTYVSKRIKIGDNLQHLEIKHSLEELLGRELSGVGE